MLPNAQLHVLNPHVHGVMRGCGGVMPTQLAAVGVAGPDVGKAQGVGGVSSFGYSGTIAHAVLRSRWGAQSALYTGVDVPFRRRRFPWSDPSHPLLQQRLAQPTNDLAIFRSPTAGRLHALIAEHVVQGHVVFPGAAYLETARAGWSAATSSSAAGACLHGVFFLQLLALDPGSDGTATLIECVFREGGSFEVRSGDGAALHGHEAPAHCKGTASASAAPPEQLGGVASRRRCCTHGGSVSVQYETYHVAGLQYGPAYRPLQQEWASEQGSGEGAWRGAVARLQWRVGVREVVVHPADLDGALQLCAMLQPAVGKDTGETRLPFAVESALLEGGTTKTWAVRAHAPHTSVCPLLPAQTPAAHCCPCA
jgi:acyl transferase domain-containing protein